MARRIPINVWSAMDTIDLKVWTSNEDLYAEVNGIDYIQVTSAKAPPSFLSLLVERFDLECRHKRKREGIACTNFNAMASHHQHHIRGRLVRLARRWRVPQR